MDALIRLDILMPVVPLVGANSPSMQDTSAQEHSDDNARSNSTVIDITNSLEERTVTSNISISLGQESDNNPTVISHPVNKVTNLEGITNGTSAAKRQLTNEYNQVVLNDHSPSKIAKTGTNNISSRSSSLHPITNTQNASTSNQNCILNCSSSASTSNAMKTHTITSGDFNWGIDKSSRSRPTDSLTFEMPGTSKSVNRPMPNVIPLPCHGSRSRDTFNPLLTLNKPITIEDDDDVPQNLDWMSEDIQKKSRQIRNNIGSAAENKVKENAIFYQLLDIFPDIDLHFLSTQCNLGLDINQISDMILGMHNNYPKASFQTPLLPPKSDLNVNLTDAFISPESSNNSPTNSTGLSDVKKNLQLVCRDEKESLLPRLIPDAISTTSTTISTTPSSAGRPDLNETQVGLSLQQLPDIDRKYSQRRSDTVQFNISANSSINNSNKKNETEPQSKFEFLMEIFPDAEPVYMQTQSKLGENDLRNFISESMEKQNYPKATVSTAKDEKVVDDSNDVGLYTTNFDIEKFLKIFPDPFQYFLDDKRNCQYSAHGYEFLKRRYRGHYIKVINNTYKELKYNLTKACERLDSEIALRSTKRSLCEIKMPAETNLPFLQEACFIEHKADIKKYLDGIAEAKKVAYEEAKNKGELIECGCCYQEVIFEDCATCDEGDLFCKSCIQKSVEVRVGDGLTTFPCLLDCGANFSLQLLKDLVDATMFSRLLQRIQLDEVKAADIEGLEGCPFCEFAIILPPETNIFQCLNPECLKESCRKCHRLSHIPQRCEEIEDDEQARARKYIEDEMTRALVRECYKCKKSFIKVDGCNKMTCTCGAKMCYICREPIVDYKHFNGPGGSENNKCPLYSTEKLLHVDAVEAVAKKALEEVTYKNPELKLKHDPSKLLPTAQSAKNVLPPGVEERMEHVMHFLQRARNLNGDLEVNQDLRADVLHARQNPRAGAPHAHDNLRVVLHGHQNLRADAHHAQQVTIAEALHLQHIVGDPPHAHHNPRANVPYNYPVVRVNARDANHNITQNNQNIEVPAIQRLQNHAIRTQQQINQNFRGNLPQPNRNMQGVPYQVNQNMEVIPPQINHDRR